MASALGNILDSIQKMEMFQEWMQVDMPTISLSIMLGLNAEEMARYLHCEATSPILGAGMWGQTFNHFLHQNAFHWGF